MLQPVRRFLIGEKTSEENYMREISRISKLSVKSDDTIMADVTLTKID